VSRRPVPHPLFPRRRPVHYLTVQTEPGAVPRNYTPGFRPYVYRGTGVDTLTPWLDDEAATGKKLTAREERLNMLASLRLHDISGDNEPLPGHVTAAQAAELLGVSPRTIERYKRDLRERSTS
jgi:hypothetical protein